MDKHVHTEASANNTKRHIHADVIKAWADGADIEWRTDSTGPWKKLEGPAAVYPYWQSHYQYRVKPKQQERWVNIYNNDFGFNTKEEADTYASGQINAVGRQLRTACVKIVFTEGDGL